MSDFRKMENMVVVIGAMKCGTSSLHKYLALHPDVSMSDLKELNFFVEEKRWKKGHKWYRSRFDGNALVRGESSPNYSKFPTFRGVPRRMYATMPDATLIYLMRNPIDRILSHYVHNVANGRERRSFEETMEELQGNNYLDSSRYYLQVEQFLEFYDRSQIMLFELSELSKEPKRVVREVWEKIGVDSSFEHSEVGRVYHVSDGKRIPRDFIRPVEKLPYGWLFRYTMPKFFGRELPKPVLSAQMRERLADALRPDVERLERYWGRDLSHWSI